MVPTFPNILLATRFKNFQKTILIAELVSIKSCKILCIK